MYVSRGFVQHAGPQVRRKMTGEVCLCLFYFILQGILPISCLPHMARKRQTCTPDLLTTKRLSEVIQSTSGNDR